MIDPRDMIDFIKMLKLARECIICKAEIKFYSENMVLYTAKYCKYKYSVFKGTILAERNIHATTIIKVIECFVNAKDLEISRQTESRILTKLNSNPIIDKYLDEMCIGGNSQVVEIDESKFGKRKYNRGHRVDNVWVFGAVDRLTRRIVVKQAEKKDKIP